MSSWRRKLEIRGFFQTCLILLLVNLLIFPPGLTAQTTSATWTGGAGTTAYENSGNWDISAVPNNNTGGPYDAFINSLGGDSVDLTIGGVAVNTMTIGGGGTSTLNVNAGLLGITIGTTEPVLGDVLTISSGGSLNINGGTAMLELSGGGSVTNSGNLTIGPAAALIIHAPASSFPVIENSGTISIGDLTGGGTLTLQDDGSGARFHFSGGSIVLSDNAGNVVQGSGVNGTETLLLDGTSLSGAGSLATAFVTNYGSLTANGTHSLTVNNTLTNWDTPSQTLIGGSYIANGGRLEIASLAGNTALNLSSASLSLSNAGTITGGGTNLLSNLTNITNSSVSVSGLGTLTPGPGTPFVITPTGGLLTMTADDNGAASLTIDNSSNIQVAGAFHNLSSTNTVPGTSTLNVLGGSTLTLGALTNEANVTGNLQQSTAIINVTGGSTLAVDTLNTTTNNGFANSQINLDGGHLTANAITQDGSGGSDLKLDHSSSVTVTGDFTNRNTLNASNVTLDNTSHLVVTGAFNQTSPQADSNDFGGQSFLILDHGSAASVGSLSNATTAYSDGTPQNHISLNNGSSLTVTGPAGSFSNVSGHVLTGGDYYVGQDSSLNYLGDNITKIASGTSVTLDHNGVIQNAPGSDAIGNSLITNNGSLTLLNGASLSLTTLTNVGPDGTLSGGVFEVGNGSTLAYGGVDIKAIDADARLTLGGTGALVSTSGQPDALSTSLNTVNGSLTLRDNAQLTLTADVPSFQNNGSVRVLSGSTLDVANTWFKNVDSNGFLNGNFEVGDSTLRYSGQDIFILGTGANVTLSGNAQIQNIAGGQHDAFVSLIGNQGNLTLNGFTLQSRQFDNNTGVITAASGNSVIDISGSSTLTNSPPGSGVLPGGTHASTHTSVPPGGTINVNDGAALTIRDTSGSGKTSIHNDGSINLLGDSNTSTLAFDSGGNQQKFVLGGSGTLYLQDSRGDTAKNIVTGVSGNESLVNGYNHGIEGSGTISNFASFKNVGVIEADGYQGLEINLNNSAVAGGGTFTNTHPGEVNVESGNFLMISSNNNTSITNNGVIGLYGCGCGDGAALILNDAGNGATFTFTGTGSIQLSDSPGNAILGFNPSQTLGGPPAITANLINDTNHTIRGSGVIGVNDFTNNGILEASGFSGLLVLSNLTNWDHKAATLTGGTYIADDQSALVLASLSGFGPGSSSKPATSTEIPPARILALNGANVTVNGSGFITGDFNSDALGSLANIQSGPTGTASLTLNGVAVPEEPYVISPNGVFTVASDDTRGHSSDTAGLFLNNSNLALGSFDDSGNIIYSDLMNTAVSTTGHNPTSTIGLTTGSTLTVGNLTNNASSTGTGTALATMTIDGGLIEGANFGSALYVNGNLNNQASAAGGFATASIFVTNQSELHVSGSLTNFAGPPSGGVSSAAVSVDNSTLYVGGDYSNTAQGSGASTSLSVTNGSQATVVGTFTNSANSLVTVDNSTLSTGAFTNSGQVTLTNGATVTVDTTTTGGLLTNNGTITLGVHEVTLPGVGTASTHLTAQPNSVNVTGAALNASTATMNLFGDHDSVTATGQFTNAGQVNLTGNNTSINSNGFDNQAKATVTFTGDQSNIFSTGKVANEGTMRFTGTNEEVSSGGDFTNTGDVRVEAGAGASFTGGNYVQNDGTTTIDSGGTLTADLVDIEGGLLTGGGTIIGNVHVGGTDVVSGTISPGDPQTLSIIGNYDQVLPGIMDLNLVNPLDGASDHVDVQGDVTLDGTLHLSLLGSDFDSVVAGTIFHIISWSGTEVGLFSSLSYSPFGNGEFFRQMFNVNGLESLTCDSGCTGLDLEVFSNVGAAPEPSTMAMIFGGMILGAAITWRKRRRGSKGIE